MAKKVLLVGHCGPDSSYLRMVIRSAVPEAQIISADNSLALTRALTEGVNLVLVNRVLDADLDETSGIDLIQRLRETNPKLKMMLISNFADAQAAAVAAGAIPGFGKRDIGSSVARSALMHALE
jgi:ActR/RegA family two-component response regulator